ncbi:aldose 1-epimerase family protein [Salinispora arenicola]|uniref:Aldose 1-epimerase n=1 Tax=Salinispora arenicola (strain CNS-205) TaxID=391037 RepID=A8M0C2_SALAI|nr:aldose 1-epimerase family protein [Salinispora arenicola]NIL55936.1 aldose 1-epimerase family protein [Salinispora arenicola]NIL60624.1 aldose 1-epimerase family protein [Salinispora arenicola]
MNSPGQRSPSGAQWTIAAAGHEAVVVEVGGGLRTYRVEGVDQLDGYASDELCPDSAGQVLAPWPNRIRDGRYHFGGRDLQLSISDPAHDAAFHGLVNWVPWRLLERSTDAVTLGYELAPTPGYPWSLRLRSRWCVGADGLRAEHEVTNSGGEPAPFGLAAHPYLRVPDVSVDDAVLRLPARSRLQVDARQLPIAECSVVGTEYDWTVPRRIGRAVLDHTFGDIVRDGDGGSAVDLTARDGGVGTRVWADGQFRWWQVFTGDTRPGSRRRRSVALEPMTCPPDAFRSGRDLITLRPGDTWRGAWGVRPADSRRCDGVRRGGTASSDGS